MEKSAFLNKSEAEFALDISDSQLFLNLRNICIYKKRHCIQFLTLEGVFIRNCSNVGNYFRFLN